MVDVGQKYNLNHIYRVPSTPGNLAVGEHAELDVTRLTLFERSLALTSDLKRLPILRSLFSMEHLSRLAGINMNASGVAYAQIYLYVINERLTDEEIGAIWLAGTWGDHEIIYGFELVIVQSAGVPTILNISEASWPFRGGLLLNNEITFALVTETATNVATAELAPLGALITFMEVDWVPVSKTEFTEFILENVYAKDD